MPPKSHPLRDNDPRTELLNIFLIKPNITDPSSILKRCDDLTAYEIPLGDQEGILYIQPSLIRTPKWTRLFEDVLDLNELDLKNSSSAALLLVKIEERYLAVAFGFGKYLLDSNVIEEHFGLHATLNMIDRDSVRSLDRKRFDALARHTREQASREVSITDFGLDMEQDLIRALSGPPSDQRLGKRVSGRDNLAVSVPANLSNLYSLLSEYLKLGLNNAYKESFPEVGNILEVERKDKRGELDYLLLEKIRRRDLDRMWLVVPDILDWTDVKFSYSNSRAGEYADIHFKTYFEHVRDLENLSLTSLARHKVYCRRESTDTLVDSWPVLRCIYAEVDRPNGTFFLDNGKWYKIDQGLVKTVNKAVASIPETTLSFPPYHDGEDEDDYNKRLAASDPSSLALLHRKDILYGGGKSRVEFCDVYSTKKIIVHVKRYGCSNRLNYLFEQGVFSATLFVGDEVFRNQLNQKLPETHKLQNPAQRPSAAEYEIAFAVASLSRNDLILPFFSRVVLRDAYRKLSNFGFRTTCTKIPIID